MNSWKRISLSLVLFAAQVVHLPAATSMTPDFSEVYGLLRSNLVGVDAKALNKAAVEGLLKQLYPEVTLLKASDLAPTKEPPGSRALSRVSVFDEAFGYFRVGQVSAGLAKAFSEAYQKVSATNRLKGLVLDLRFAAGQDYAAALATADWFFPSEQPLLDWGAGVKKSVVKENAIRLPVMVLVNSKTAAAAEALAGILRQSDVGLLVGSATAGKASEFKEFPLGNGERLRIATTPVKLGNGTALPLTGLKPDIQVQVSPEDERAYWEDVYRVLPYADGATNAGVSVTNRANVAVTNRAGRRMTEAELVRMHREGVEVEEEMTNTARRAAEPGKPVVQDPVLVRALDILKGLAVVRPLRPRPT